MAYSKREIKNVVKKIVSYCEMPVESVYLFGSYAYGSPNKFSDVDLAFISKRFRNISKGKRIEKLLNTIYKARIALNVDIEPLGFTPEEIKKASKWDIAGEIKQKGIKIYG